MVLLEKAKRYIWKLLFRNGRLSYSQSGEDLILDTIFNSKRKGTYVDVGANNPFVQSNTKFFYDKGWRGINIDALPGSMIPFRKARPADINVEMAVSGSGGNATYHQFENSLYNTFDGSKVEETKTYSRYLGVREIKTERLADILRQHKVQAIDFLSLDVEGYELEVLRSNNWTDYRPKVIVVEYFHKGLKNLELNPVHQFLNSVGYTFFCCSVTNAFYVEDSFLNERFHE